jgi:hypothetical protein
VRRPLLSRARPLPWEGRTRSARPFSVSTTRGGRNLFNVKHLRADRGRGTQTAEGERARPSRAGRPSARTTAAILLCFFQHKGVEDLTFEYGRPDGAVVQGTVNYEGIGPSLNNLVLAVDPDSGAGTLVNASPFDIQIDGYAILSGSGALLSEDGQWNSLEDQALSAWEEANVSANQLAELNPTNSTSLNAGGHLELGTLFDTDGERDLTLEFFLAGEDSARPGTLLYEAVEITEPMLPGDYSGNGLVEQADLDLVLGNWGADADDVPPTWIRDLPEGFVDQAELDKVLGNWGSQAPGLAATAAVPEPTTMVMGIFAAALLCCRGWSHLRLNLTSQIRGDES